MGSNIALHHIFLLFLILYNTFLYIVQYLLFLVHIPIPHITPHPQHCVHIHPDPPQPDPQPDQPDPTPPPPPKKKIFFFEFSHKLQFFVHIHPDPPPSPNPNTYEPPPPPNFFCVNFLKNFNSSFTSTLTLLT